MKFYLSIARFLTAFVLIFGAAITAATAQSAAAPPRTTSFALPAAAPNAEMLAKHDLKWIKTGNDFDQQKFVTSGEVDKEIENRIKAYDRETAIVTFDVPINSGRLSYVKFQKYVDFNKDISNLSVSTIPGGALNRSAHFWRYGDIDIAVPGDTYKDQLNVYAVARAIEILKYRYTKAYQRLFVETRNFQRDTLGYAKWKNKYSVLLFSFDESPAFIAAGVPANGTTANGTSTVVDGFTEYSNVSVVSIDNINIQGNQNSGSQPIYKASSDENYIRYLREGLVETLVHEMLHRYIDYMNSYKEVFNQLYNRRVPENPAYLAWIRDLNEAAEEAIVTTTSLHYFLREGGLQSNLHLYYDTELNFTINKLTASSIANNYSQLIDPNGKFIIYKDRLRLDVFD